jgi:hypothetical protein
VGVNLDHRVPEAPNVHLERVDDCWEDREPRVHPRHRVLGREVRSIDLEGLQDGDGLVAVDGDEEALIHTVLSRLWRVRLQLQGDGAQRQPLLPSVSSLMHPPWPM